MAWVDNFFLCILLSVYTFKCHKPAMGCSYHLTICALLLRDAAIPLLMFRGMAQWLSGTRARGRMMPRSLTDSAQYYISPNTTDIERAERFCGSFGCNLAVPSHKRYR